MTPESEEPLGGPADRDAHGLEEMLDAAFAHADLDDNELYAIRRWQGMDRFYVHIQRRLLDGRHEDDVDREEDSIIDLLDGLLDRLRLQRDVIVWRGIRNARSIFGRESTDLASLLGRTVPRGGFIATSTARVGGIAFTEPGIDPVVLRLRVRAGTGAIWVSKLGDPPLAGQRELLLGPAAMYIEAIAAGGDGILEIHVNAR